MWRYLTTSTTGCGMLLATMLTAGLSPQAAADEKEALAAIEKIGGTVRQMASNRTDWKVEFHLGGRSLTDKDLAHVFALLRWIRSPLIEDVFEVFPHLLR